MRLRKKKCVGKVSIEFIQRNICHWLRVKYVDFVIEHFHSWMSVDTRVLTNCKCNILRRLTMDIVYAKIFTADEFPRRIIISPNEIYLRTNFTFYIFCWKKSLDRDQAKYTAHRKANQMFHTQINRIVNKKTSTLPTLKTQSDILWLKQITLFVRKTKSEHRTHLETSASTFGPFSRRTNDHQKNKQFSP